MREDEKPHRLKVHEVRNMILMSKRQNIAPDIETLDNAHEAHIKAKTLFSVSNTDRTMINLIGTWSRLTRIMNELDIKYQGRVA